MATLRSSAMKSLPNLGFSIKSRQYMLKLSFKLVNISFC